MKKVVLKVVKIVLKILVVWSHIRKGFFKVESC